MADSGRNFDTMMTGYSDPLHQAIAASPEFQQAVKTRRGAHFSVNVPGVGVKYITISDDGHLTVSNTSRTQNALRIGPTLIPGALGVASNIGGGANGAVTAAQANPSMDVGATSIADLPGGVLPGFEAGTAGASSAAAEAPALAGSAAAGGTAAAAAARGAGDVARTASGGIDYAKLIAGLSSVLPLILATHQTDAQKDLTAQQNDLLKLQTDRMRQQQPLFDSTQRGFMAMLPTFAKGGQ